MRRQLIGSVACLALSGCQIVDTNLTTRINSINAQSDAAQDDGVLLNILRARDGGPLNFIAVSKVSGTQTTDLKLGLPTLTEGPGQTVLQRQFVFGSNSWENSANSSFDSNPLVTSDFYRNMLSSIDPVSMNALLEQGLSREVVFLALIDSIRIKSTEGEAVFRNDPTLDEGQTCPEESEYTPPDNGVVPRNCEYHRFRFLIRQAFKWGFNVETQTVEPPAALAPPRVAAPAGAQITKPADATTKPTVKGRFCFDPAFADVSQLAALSNAEMKEYLCGDQTWLTRPIPMEVAFSAKGLVYTLQFRLRSPVAAFAYFGRVLRAPAETTALGGGVQGASPADRSQLVALVGAQSSPCFAKTQYEGVRYCVPRSGAGASRQVFALLSELVALNISASTLPTTLDVRLQ